jgi:hypothetical protein
MFFIIQKTVLPFVYTKGWITRPTLGAGVNTIGYLRIKNTTQVNIINIIIYILNNKIKKYQLINILFLINKGQSDLRIINIYI